MTFFSHPKERLPVEPPRGVYARLDTIDGDEQGVALFDCLSTRWVDEVGPDSPALADMSPEDERFPEADLSILSIDLEVLHRRLPDIAEGQWCQLIFDDSGGAEDEADQFLTLFSDPTARGIAELVRLSGIAEADLDRLAGWGDAEGASQTDLFEALNPPVQTDAAAIYDVGQGAATALLSDGVPQLYFDLGGSATGNWRSFPDHLDLFCFCAKPTIVLSHWDWDHWSSALRDRRALQQTWVLPLQNGGKSLGPVHAGFLALLKQYGQVLWWDNVPGGLPVLWTAAWLQRASGARNNRNESGLFLVTGHGLLRYYTLLLPGDASFKHLQLAVTCEFDHVMVPHHGGKTDLTALPRPRTKQGHAIYSYGVGNIFLHPRAETVRAYRKGWKKNAHTALRTASGFGHVGIDLTGQTPRPTRLACGCAAPLLPQHWID